MAPLLFNHAFSGDGRRGQYFPFSINNFFYFCIRGWKLGSSSPLGKESMAQIHKGVDFDFGLP